MKKKFVYIGIVLLIAAFASAIIGGSALNPNKLISEKNLSVSAMGFSFLSFSIPNGSAIFLIGNLTKPADFYVFNSTGFTDWSHEVGINSSIDGYNYALSLKGLGVFYIFRNVTTIVLPSITSLYNSTPAYSYNSLGYVPGGTYYAVVDNTNGSKSAGSALGAKIGYIPGSALASGKFKSFVYEEAFVGVLFFVLLISAIIIIVYGLLKSDASVAGAGVITKGKGKKGDELSNEEIDALYKNIKKKKNQ